MSTSRIGPRGCGGSVIFVLDIGRYELRRGAEAHSCRAAGVRCLPSLVSNHDRYVSKEELFDSVWGERFVGEAALTSRIKAARRALGDDGESQRYIRTVRGRGYQFVGAIRTGTPAATDGDEPAPEPPLRQHIAFCRAADGVRLAYAVVGEGPPLVRAANWMTHLGFDIEPGVAALGARTVPPALLHPVRRAWMQAIQPRTQQFLFR